MVCRCSAKQKDEYDHESFYTKWDSNYRENFRENIKTNIDQINSACSQLQYNVDECTINNVVNSLSDILNDSAKPYFVHKCNVNAKSGYFNSIKKENQWLNEDCKNSRKAYLTALNQFNCNPSNENRILLMHRKAKYKKLVVKTKRIYFNNKCIEIKALQRQSPKLFWNHFKSKRKVAGESISPQNFFEYFRNISTNCNDNFSNPSVSQYVQENNCVNPAVYSELDKEFTQEELLASIKNLKGGKASGCDNLLYEYVIETFDILGNVWVKLFNAIFSSGHFPEKWTEGVIIPLHKKGNRDDVNNYRGITLLSCLGKIFTSVLNERLKSWSADNDIITDAQFGFKEKHSTIDAIFALHSIITKYVTGGRRLYCAFIDFQKAFDRIYLDGLWFKLLKLGVNGRMLRILISMYNNVRSCVKHKNIITEYFSCSVGLRQGEILSPILFNIFVNDLEMKLQQNVEGGITIDDINMFLLFYADDTVILSETIQGLQESLNNLYDYCNEWNLKVNVEKTQTLVFRKSGHIKSNEKWYYGNELLVNTDHFNYLGVIVSYTGSFSKHINNLSKKGLKSLYALSSKLNCYIRNLDVSILLNLFDSHVASVLNYGCEIWGFHNVYIENF